MGLRGLVAVVLLLAAGIVGGFAAAVYLEPVPISTGVPQPVTATDPSIPIDPPPPLREDPPEAPLQKDLPLRKVSVGTDTYRFDFPAPVGWVRNETSSNEVKYKLPGNPGNTFILRLEQVVSQHETIPDMVIDRIADLKGEVENYQQLDRTYDTLEFSYVFDGYRRFGMITWMDLTGSGKAEAEIALTGRAVDVPGMQDLFPRLIRGIRAG